MNVLKLNLALLFALSTAAALGQSMQNAAAPTNDFYAPYYREQSGGESAFWNNSFTNAYNGANNAANVAPGGSALAKATITQTQPLTFGQIVSGGIYTGNSTGNFILNYSVSNPTTFSNGVGTVLFQTETSGYQLNYGSAALTYTNASGTQTLSPVSSGQFYYTGTPGVGGASSADVIAAWKWNLPAGDNVTNFSISFNGAASHVDLGRAMLDATPVFQSTTANMSRWMYSFDQTTDGEDQSAPVFTAFGYTGAFGETLDGQNFYFDTRDGQYLLGWNTTNSIPAGQGARNYLVHRVRVTLTLDQDNQYAYDGTLHDYRNYFPTNDPNYLPTGDSGSPVELYGVGYRGGFTNSGGAYVPYSATNYLPTSSFFADASTDPYAGNEYSVRAAYAACFDTNGALVDVSDNVGDDGTNEMPNPFEVAPFAVGYNTNFVAGQLTTNGTQITFDLNLNDPLIYSYVQQGLNQGNLNFIVTSLLYGDYYGAPNWPEFYTLFSPTAYPNQYPLIAIDATVVRTSVDNDGDGLPDDWEEFYFGHLGAGATNSFAHDGVSNLAKYLAGTDPTSSTNNFRLLSIQQTSGGTELRFNSAPSRQYSIQWSADLQHWQTVTNPSLLYLSDWLTKTGTNVAYPAPVYAKWLDTNAISSQRFYRVNAQ